MRVCSRVCLRGCFMLSSSNEREKRWFRVHLRFYIQTTPRSPPSLAVQTFYEEGCAGLGCNIAGHTDCRQCIFDSTAHTEVGTRFLPFFPARTNVSSESHPNACQQKHKQAATEKNNRHLIVSTSSTVNWLTCVNRGRPRPQARKKSVS